MTSRGGLYVGRAGQMAVMAEFLVRGYNVAIPEVDIGDDIFVVRDSDGDLTRIQVKTARGRSYRRGDGCSAQFSIGHTQLATPITPDLTYVLVVRWQARWSHFLVITRARLHELHETAGLGSRSGGRVRIHTALRGATASASGTDLSDHLDDWSAWPVITH